MENQPKRKRRWFQFRLRTLLLGVTLLAVVCGYVGWQAKIVKERHKAVATYQAIAGFAVEVGETRGAGGATTTRWTLAGG